MYIGHARSCGLGQSLVDYREVWQCKVSFSLLVVARAIACMNKFQS